MKIKSFLPGISIAILISLVAWYLGILFPIIGGPFHWPFHWPLVWQFNYRL